MMNDESEQNRPSPRQRRFGLYCCVDRLVGHDAQGRSFVLVHLLDGPPRQFGGVSEFYRK